MKRILSVPEAIGTENRDSPEKRTKISIRHEFTLKVHLLSPQKYELKLGVIQSSFGSTQGHSVHKLYLQTISVGDPDP